MFLIKWASSHDIIVMKIFDSPTTEVINHYSTSDCGHWCNPGAVVHSWNTGLMNILIDLYHNPNL